MHNHTINGMEGRKKGRAEQQHKSVEDGWRSLEKILEMMNDDLFVFP